MAINSVNKTVVGYSSPPEQARLHLEEQKMANESYNKIDETENFDELSVSEIKKKLSNMGVVTKLRKKEKLIDLLRNELKKS